MFTLLLIGGVGVGLIAIKAIRGSSEMVQADNLLAEYEPADPKADPAVGPTYRNVCALDGYPTLEGPETLYELFTSSVERFADNPCLGTRSKVRSEAFARFQMLTRSAKATGQSIHISVSMLAI